MQQINKNLDFIFQRRFKQFGPTARGSFWLSKSRQNDRFAIICEQVRATLNESPMTIADVGCGYGALVPYLQEKRPFPFECYYGIDICFDLISYCKLTWADQNHIFKIGAAPPLPVTVTVMSGTYNLSVTKCLRQWEDYLFQCLEVCWGKTKSAMIFNLQVEDTARISKSYIYYADIPTILTQCVRRFGPTRVIRTKGLAKDATFVVLRRN